MSVKIILEDDSEGPAATYSGAMPTPSTPPPQPLGLHHDQQPAAPRTRLQDLDALRAFALLGIFLVNVQLFVEPAALTGAAPVYDDAASDLVNAVVGALFAGKFYILFSFLFGYSFTLLWDASARRGVAVVPVALRRFLGLFVLGLAHGLLLFTGDILLTYALAGLILLAARHASISAARTAAITITAIMGVGLLGLAALLGAVEQFGGLSAEELSGAGFGPAPELLRTDYASYLAGAYPLTLPNLLLVQGPVALAMFFLGLAAAKARWIETTTAPRLRRMLLIGLAVGLPGGVASGWLQVYAGTTSGELLAFALATLTGPFLTAAYVAGLLLAFRTGPGARLRAAMAPAGRMALTNYVAQSAVMALVFTSYGAGLSGSVHPGTAVVLCLAVWAAQLGLSALWMRRFARGPLEGLHRALTYWRAPRWT
ncbi:DUF418 domain-containing protein [Zhihengliuella flava]|uniref:DUF418 domain-containing protein n=1 Tax=Zhihengliuella flava TaxID=1285193 RepID=A0A931D974_9MICC|nr:DUF418 domain-containing protein [Zhihengliuella flava]MBG6084684.1 uncharacterized protein [Zhihengliuella flava]